MALPVEVTQRGLNALPVSMRRMAMDACKPDASPATVERVLSDLRADSPKIPALGLLPVCFAHLDPAAIPSLEELSQKDADAAVFRGTYALNALFRLDPKALPRRILFCFWPRVFLWYMLVLQRGHPLDLEFAFHVPFLNFAHACGRLSGGISLICGTEGYVAQLLCIWELWGTMNGMPADQLLLLLANATHHLNFNTPEGYSQFVEGAGADLARLFSTSLSTVMDRADTVSNEHDVEIVLSTIRALLGVILDSDEAGGPQHTPRLGEPMGTISIHLVFLKFVPLLLRCGHFLTGLPVKLRNHTKHHHLEALNICVDTLCRFISNTHGLGDDSDRMVIEALESDLLRFIIHCGRIWAAASDTAELLETSERAQALLSILLTNLLPAELIDRHCAMAARDRLKALDEDPTEVYRTDSSAVRASSLFQPWQIFLQAVAKSSNILGQLSECDHVSYKTCDNVECDTVAERSTFQRCSGCQSAYYCSKQCQRADWRRPKGHREVCKHSQDCDICVARRMNLRFPRSDDDYRHAMLNHYYHENWTEIYVKHVQLILKHPRQFFLGDKQEQESFEVSGPALMTCFNFAGYPVSFEVLSTGDRPTEPPWDDFFSEQCATVWANLVARASHASRRFHLHVLLILLNRYGNMAQFSFVPLRCDAEQGREIHDALLDVARRLLLNSTTDENAIREEVEKLRLAFIGIKQMHC
ncbi:hypothetical protein C8F01DRAFT_1375450 [Mycena amicta]|nr:hypothetical protein C8F01DRAFT_1375450 [Mycena amicta]